MNELFLKNEFEQEIAELNRISPLPKRVLRRAMHVGYLLPPVQPRTKEMQKALNRRKQR